MAVGGGAALLWIPIVCGALPPRIARREEAAVKAAAHDGIGSLRMPIVPPPLLWLPVVAGKREEVAPRMAIGGWTEADVRDTTGTPWWMLVASNQAFRMGGMEVGRDRREEVRPVWPPSGYPATACGPLQRHCALRVPVTLPAPRLSA